MGEKARKNFLAVSLNIWGDREVTWTDGKKFSEKGLAAFMKIQFTPTLVFSDERGGIVARLNGYYPPHRFEAVLDWVAGRRERKIALAEYLRTAVREPAGEQLHNEPFFLKPPYDLRRRGAKPRRVLRDAVLRGVRRAAPRRLSPRGNRPIARALRCRALRARGAHSGDDSGGRQAPGRGLGALARRLLHAFGGFLRRGRQGGVPHRSLPAAVPPLGLTRIRRRGGLLARAEFPALSPGARRGAARARRNRRSVAVAPRRALLRRVYDGRPFLRPPTSCRSRHIITSSSKGRSAPPRRASPSVWPAA